MSADWKRKRLEKSQRWLHIGVDTCRKKREIYKYFMFIYTFRAIDINSVQWLLHPKLAVSKESVPTEHLSQVEH